MPDELITNQPPVSIVIPTLNSERTLEVCLLAVESQEYAPIEVVVVDGGSSDGTLSIARRHGVNLMLGRHGLLESRCLGVKHSGGDPVVLLDSDQYLAPNAIRKAVHLLERYDMIFLGESSYNQCSRLSRLYRRDRELIDKIREFDPLRSTLLPRVFRRKVITRAIEAIPQPLVRRVIGLDHAILYFEAYRISPRVALLPSAVYHDEPSEVTTLVRKNYRYGRADSLVLYWPRYRRLVLSKMRPRAGIQKTENGRLAIASATLLTLKSIPYLTGFAIGLVANLRGRGLR